MKTTRFLAAAFLALALLMPATASAITGNAELTFGGLYLLDLKTGKSHDLGGITAGLTIRPGTAEEPSKFRFRASYNETPLLTLGATYDIYRESSVDIAVGGSMLFWDEPQVEAPEDGAMYGGNTRIGGAAVVAFYFLQDKLPMEFSVWIGGISTSYPDDQPLLVGARLGFLTN